MPKAPAAKHHLSSLSRAEAEKREETGWPLAKTNQLGSRDVLLRSKHPTEDLSSRPEQSLTNPGQSITVSPRGYSRRRHLEDVLVIGELNSA
jgi:hypothetical protein